MKLTNAFVLPRSTTHSSSPSPARSSCGSSKPSSPPRIDADGFVLPNKNGKKTGAVEGTGLANVKMQYFGGGVLDHPDVKNMYVGDYFKTTQGKQDAAFNDKFMADLVKNKDFTSVLHQYGVGDGTVEKSGNVAGTFKKVTQKQLEQMAKDAATKDKNPNKQLIYNFVLPPNAELVMSDGTSSKQGLGGFHSSVHLPDGREVFYSAEAWSKGSNGIDFTNGSARDNVAITESHEIAEAATDPHVQDAIDTNDWSKLGWMDVDNGEIGDIEVNDAPPGTPLSTMFGKMDGFDVQKIWSQKDRDNEVKAKKPGPVEPLPPAAPPPSLNRAARGPLKAA